MEANTPSSLERAGTPRLQFNASHHVCLSAREQRHIDAIGADILRNQPSLGRALPFGPLVRQGFEDLPSLMIEDHSSIQLAAENQANQNLSYRSSMLAGDGDIVIVGGERDESFEQYCQERLGLGAPQIFSPAPTAPMSTLTSACLKDEALLDDIAQIAQSAGGLNIVPYLATGGIWRLGMVIAERAKVPVYIAGPKPRITQAVNDKLWFARWAAELLGKDAVPHARAVFGMGALAGHLHRFMQQHDTVAIKLSHSAASMGNMVFDSAEFAQVNPAALAKQLANAMQLRGWTKPFPMQVTAWEGPILSTPSAQLWIPAPDQGPPIIEAIFDQVTRGKIARFAGGVPSARGPRLTHEIAHAATMLGTLLQTLGYFGRCSFDALVIGEDEQSSKLHWVECNGRWGGVSIPLSLTNRIVGDWKGRGLLIFDHQDDEQTELSTDQFLGQNDHLLLRKGEDHGAVLLTPGTLKHGRVELLILAKDQATSRAIGDDFIASLARSGIRTNA